MNRFNQDFELESNMQKQEMRNKKVNNYYSNRNTYHNNQVLSDQQSKAPRETYASKVNYVKQNNQNYASTTGNNKKSQQTNTQSKKENIDRISSIHNKKRNNSNTKNNKTNRHFNQNNHDQNQNPLLLNYFNHSNADYYTQSIKHSNANESANKILKIITNEDQQTKIKNNNSSFTSSSNAANKNLPSDKNASSTCCELMSRLNKNCFEVISFKPAWMKTNNETITDSISTPSIPKSTAYKAPFVEIATLNNVKANLNKIISIENFSFNKFALKKSSRISKTRLIRNLIRSKYSKNRTYTDDLFFNSFNTKSCTNNTRFYLYFNTNDSYLTNESKLLSSTVFNTQTIEQILAQILHRSQSKIEQSVEKENSIHKLDSTPCNTYNIKIRKSTLDERFFFIYSNQYIQLIVNNHSTHLFISFFEYCLSNINTHPSISNYIEYTNSFLIANRSVFSSAVLAYSNSNNNDNDSNNLKSKFTSCLRKYFIQLFVNLFLTINEPNYFDSKKIQQPDQEGSILNQISNENSKLSSTQKLDAMNEEEIKTIYAKPRPSYLIERDCHIFGGCQDEDATDEFFISSGAIYQSWPYVYEPGFQMTPLIEYVPSRISKSINHLDGLLENFDNSLSEYHDENQLQLPSYSIENFGINLFHVGKEKKKKQKVRRKRRENKRQVQSKLQRRNSNETDENDDGIDESYSTSQSFLVDSDSVETSNHDCYDDEEDDESFYEDSDISDSDSESIIEYKKRHAFGLNNLNLIVFANEQTSQTYGSCSNLIDTYSSSSEYFKRNEQFRNSSRLSNSYYMNSPTKQSKKIRFLSQTRVTSSSDLSIYNQQDYSSENLVF